MLKKCVFLLILISSITSKVYAKTATETMAEFNKQYCSARDVMVLDPTKENIDNFMKLQNFIISKSNIFADMSQKVINENPELRSSNLPNREFYYLSALRTWTANDCKEFSYSRN